MNTWKARLGDRIPPDLGRQIDVFETQIELRRRERLDEKLFAEIRLRRGVYGQRYDNGRRHDGVGTQTLTFPCGDRTKGPGTVFDAPGMVRIKLPMGRLGAEQMEVLAELAEEYADEIVHVTTRQDVQLHFVHIDDTPALMRRLAAVGVTTREACGNVVRNVCACPRAGVCPGEAFDVTGYAGALADFLLGHQDTHDFGRKFKIALSGCSAEACGLARIHDVGLVAVSRELGGQLERGFRFYVGGGLGAVPRQAALFDPFVPPEEILPLTQAICRVFARLGEKSNRAKARLKFLLDKLGLDELRRLVLEERQVMPADERWTSWLEAPGAFDDRPSREKAPLTEAALLTEAAGDPAFGRWRRSNVAPQRQAGYVTATVRLPLGDASADQMRGLAALARRFTGDTVRASVEQNLVFRWLPEASLPDFHRELAAIGLAGAGAGTIVDITACPGTDTCKLGISASRGLAAELERRLMGQLEGLDPGVRSLRVKISGCFNACGQHHIADVGFLGVSRNVGGRRVAHFQLVVGGEWANNGGGYGLPIGAFPAKRIPQVLDELVGLWVAERVAGERFQGWVARVGRAHVKRALDHLWRVPPYEQAPELYVDWGDAREYTIGDLGIGECAGEIVSLAEFGLAASEREVFEAQLALDGGELEQAMGRARGAMVSAARALVRTLHRDVGESPEAVVAEFRARFHDTRLFHDPFAGAKFAHYLFKAYEQPADPEPIDAGAARQRIDEAQLFIEAAHACHGRLLEEGLL